MLSRIALVLLGSALFTQAVASAHTLTSREICLRSIPTVREMWLKGSYDAPPAVATMMVDIIDGRLPQVRQQLRQMKPADARLWRQSAMVAAAWSGQSAVVDGYSTMARLSMEGAGCHHSNRRSSVKNSTA